MAYRWERMWARQIQAKTPGMKYCQALQVVRETVKELGFVPRQIVAQSKREAAANRVNNKKVRTP